MALYLVQHGKCKSKEVDPDRPLTEEGSREVRHIAEVAAGYGIEVEKILHSGKTRAGETAEIFAEMLHPPGGVEASGGLDPGDDVRGFSADAESNTMVVGHLPFMEKLASYLVTGSTKKRIFKFQNGGIVCLDIIDGDWVIKWALMPRIS